MLLAEVLCCSILMITITESWAYPEDQHNMHVAKKQDPIINRREATLLLEGAPVDKIFQRSKIIRRISKKRQVPLRTTYGPSRLKYAPTRTIKKPSKNKYRRKVPSKHPHKMRGNNPWYGVPKRHPTKPIYGPPKLNQQNSNYYGEGLGFAEPPTTHHSSKTKPSFTNDHSHSYNKDHITIPTKPDHTFISTPMEHQFVMNEFPYEHSDFSKPGHDDYQASKQSYGEPPVDSYGVPIKENLHDLTFNPTSSYPHQDERYYSNQPWQNFEDMNIETSNIQSEVKKPLDREVYHPPIVEVDDEQNMNSYSDIYNSRQVKEKKKKKASYFENIKLLNQPWKGKMRDESHEEVIVGGQYAEPPARYVPKFQPSAAMNDDENEFTPPRYSIPDDFPSATMSSYVNYKNSNMAFSPQNLNDVFSIVDKK